MFPNVNHIWMIWPNTFGRVVINGRFNLKGMRFSHGKTAFRANLLEHLTKLRLQAVPIWNPQLSELLGSMLKKMQNYGEDNWTNYYQPRLHAWRCSIMVSSVWRWFYSFMRLIFLFFKVFFGSVFAPKDSIITVL